MPFYVFRRVICGLHRGIICGLHRGSFAVRDNLRSNLGIFCGLGIICGRGTLASNGRKKRLDRNMGWLQAPGDGLLVFVTCKV